MQRTSKNTDLFLVCLFALLAILQIILLVQPGYSIWIFFLIPIWAATVFFSFYFWFRLANPAARFSDAFITWANSLFIFFRKPSPIFRISSGALQGEYFLLKNKPRVAILYISPDSAAAVQSKDEKLRILKPGFHNLKRGDEIRLCFDLRYHSFIFGPLENENPFDFKKSSESYTNYHARQLRAQKVKSFTRDAREVYPSFQVAYQLITENSQFEDRLMVISRYFLKMGKSGNAAPILEEFIAKRLMDLWSGRISEHNAEELFRNNALAQMMTWINDKSANTDRGNTTNHRASAAIHNSTDSILPAMQFTHIYLNQIWLQPTRRQVEGIKP
jgi:hypothetical protein